MLALAVARKPDIDAEGRVIIESKDFAVMARGERLGEALMKAVRDDIITGGIRKRGRAQNSTVGAHYAAQYGFEVDSDLTTWYPPRTQIPRVDEQPSTER